LKLIASTGSRNASIDMGAAKELGITVSAMAYRSSPTIELTWALILASLRGVVHENNSIRNGGWQKSVGQDLGGKIMGVVGPGNIGGQVARINTYMRFALAAAFQIRQGELAFRATTLNLFLGIVEIGYVDSSHAF
jgi:phosphoglycerate dehydrogenase-like enzyme